MVYQSEEKKKRNAGGRGRGRGGIANKRKILILYTTVEGLIGYFPLGDIVQFAFAYAMREVFSKNCVKIGRVR